MKPLPVGGLFPQPISGRRSRLLLVLPTPLLLALSVSVNRTLNSVYSPSCRRSAWLDPEEWASDESKTCPFSGLQSLHPRHGRDSVEQPEMHYLELLVISHCAMKKSARSLAAGRMQFSSAGAWYALTDSRESNAPPYQVFVIAYRNAGKEVNVRFHIANANANALAPPSSCSSFSSAISPRTFRLGGFLCLTAAPDSDLAYCWPTVPLAF